LGGYHASKWALEGLTESLAQEVAGFGIKVTLVEPGGFDTDWGSASAVVADTWPEYAAIHDAMAWMASGPQPKPIGFGSAILKVIDAEKAPLRVFFGERPTQLAPYIYQQRLAEWAGWAPSPAKPTASRSPRGPGDRRPAARDPSARARRHCRSSTHRRSGR
jgi:NAD(P)-dependent dehydrogenase (short-subunit alcohol dehydrogenase family)